MCDSSKIKKCKVHDNSIDFTLFYNVFDLIYFFIVACADCYNISITLIKCKVYLSTNHEGKSQPAMKMGDQNINLSAKIKEPKAQ